MFSAEYVDKLVASFWTKVDQKIEQAVSHYQASPQAGQQSNAQDNAQTQDTDAEDENKGKKKTLFYMFHMGRREGLTTSVGLQMKSSGFNPACLGHCFVAITLYSQYFW